MLSGRHGIDPGEAFNRLRHRARSTNTRLHEVCQRVVAGNLDVEMD